MNFRFMTGLFWTARLPWTLSWLGKTVAIASLVAIAGRVLSSQSPSSQSPSSQLLSSQSLSSQALTAQLFPPPWGRSPVPLPRPTPLFRDSHTPRKVGTPRSQTPVFSTPAQVQIHTLPDFRPAATVWVNTQPLLTFATPPKAIIGPPLPFKVAGSQPPVPADQANQLAAVINSFIQQGGDARDLRLQQPAPDASYQIVRKLPRQPDQVWVVLGSNVIEPPLGQRSPALPSVSSALHVVNQLRRNLGQAPPLIAAEIERAHPRPPGHSLLGDTLASWYGPGFHGNLTANGEIYDQRAMTAAHRELPFGTLVKVTNLITGQAVTVRINDRGPYVGGRDIDLSAAAAEALGSIQLGVVPVRLEVLP